MAKSTLYADIFDAVRAVPRGRVATYGQVALMAGIPGHARLVGYALHTLEEGTDVPWHRVINARGSISLHAQFGGLLQREFLEAEGVVFGPDDKVSLRDYRWEGF
jgi:methylated-DNA-protein-cysteine methyltransferase related protein